MATILISPRRKVGSLSWSLPLPQRADRGYFMPSWWYLQSAQVHKNDHNLSYLSIRWDWVPRLPARGSGGGCSGGDDGARVLLLHLGLHNQSCYFFYTVLAFLQYSVVQHDLILKLSWFPTSRGKIWDYPRISVHFLFKYWGPQHHYTNKGTT